MNPRQSVLLSMDVYRLLGEVLAGESGVVIDGGANVGEATKALRRHMPGADIHAFEPVSEAYTNLERVCAACGATAHRMALGDEDGSATINVNKNLWTCSLLDANERGHAFHDDWCETVRTEEVRVTRLDTWAIGQGVDEVALLKLDLQGFELAALRGVGDLLPTVRAIYSEAQITPEYAGASTFGELDVYLRGRGFGLYQIADLCLKGAHLEPSCCDGLWLREDVLARVRESAAPATLNGSSARSSMVMSSAMDLCAKRGWSRIGVYGAGAHSVACAPVLATPPVEVVCFVDDGRAGGSLWGTPVVSRDEARSRGIDAVILSSDRVEDLLLERCDVFLNGGCPVVRLYGERGVEVIESNAPRGVEAAV